MDIAITKMSSRGQIVIPSDMRENLKEGEKLAIIRNDDQLILKRVSDFSSTLEEDLAFARRTEQAYEKYERGEFVEMEADDFFEEIQKW
jgi:AbrB family looped-hinge helix DNA binding protein